MHDFRSTFDKIIHVKDGASVHRSLLCNISDETSELLERYDEFEAALPSKPDTQDVHQDVLSLLLDSGESGSLSSKRAVEMWTGFLYGQPMWTFRGKESNKEDFAALMEVYNWARACSHVFAEDGALDGIVAMLHDHPDVPEDPVAMLARVFALRQQRFWPVIYIMIDFIVFGKDAENVKAWAFDTDCMREGEEETFLLKVELQKHFREKADLERLGQAMPDLTERCRYHAHAARPCYLGPVGQTP